MKKTKNSARSALSPKGVFYLLLVVVALPVTLVAMNKPGLFFSGAAPADGVPVLEPGFPVSVADESACVGSFGAGSTTALVGNIDDTSELEIVAGACAKNSLYAWTNQGRLLSGWPVPGRPIGESWVKGLPSLGNLEGTSAASEVFSIFQDDSRVPSMFAYNNMGQKLTGWPKAPHNYISNPASLYDIDGDGLDEVLVGEGDSRLNCYKADGKVCPGWPSDNCGGVLVKYFGNDFVNSKIFLPGGNVF